MIKKARLIIFLVITLICFSILPVIAMYRGFSPTDYPGYKNYGIGVYFAPDVIKLYSEPSENAELIEVLKWHTSQMQLDSSSNTIFDPEEVFIAYYPYRNIALLAVDDEINGWIKVIYNQKKEKTGWLKLEQPKDETSQVGRFYTWLTFMQNIAKKNGIYYLATVPSELKILRSKPDDDAPRLVHEFTCIKRLVPKLIRGNWVLVKIYDFDRESPIGWIRWRDKDGKLLIFTDLDQ